MVKLANPSATNGLSLSIADVVWAALEKVGQKQKDANALQDGSNHQIQLQIRADVDGQSFEESLEVAMTIGHQQTRSSSVNPQVPELLAWILSKLNRVTRDRILSDIPTEFQEQGGMPVSNPVLVDEAKGLLRQLRQTKTVTARGAVRCEYPS